MKIEFGTVTSVFKSDEKGAQLINITSNISDKEYENCEIVTTKGLSALPTENDLVVFIEISNGNIIVIGVVEPFDLDLKSGEVLMHSGVKVESEKSSDYTQNCSIKQKPDGSIDIVSTKGITITAPIVTII